jgi:tetratricopeptide (TPR) repeat protein
MSETPHDVQFALAEFDRSQLPEAQRSLEGDEFREAVREHLAAQFSGHGGAAEVVVTADRVIIRWQKEAVATSLAEQGSAYIRQGEADKGIALLRVALERDPDDAGALLNLGMILGERGEFEESISLLERLITFFPDYPGAWVALGVARGRGGFWNDAILAFRQAVARDELDGLARKNLGAALSQTGKLEEGLSHLKAAVVLLTEDPEAWLNLAMNLEQAGEVREAEVAYSRVIALDPGGALSERAELGRNRITGEKLRANGVDVVRANAVVFCQEAIRLFDAMAPNDVKRITLEIAMIGSKGLSVQDPTTKYTLRSVPGAFSGLQLLCTEYVGFKIIDPTVDIGFDIAAEYEAAKNSFN